MPNPTAAVALIDQTRELAQPGALPGVADLVPTARMGALIPAKPTRREKQAGAEIAYRIAVQRGHEMLHRNAAETIGRMHDWTHRALVAGICGMNARVRAVEHPDDRAELERLTAVQKEMYATHQFALLDASAYRVAREADRELYVVPGRGFLGLGRGR